MDLAGWLLRVAAARPHVFVAAAPGQTLARLRLEAEIGRRDWPFAPSPADADLLVVVGRPGPQLAVVVETIWGQMPAPRARVGVTATTGTADVAAALDAAVRELADAGAQRRDPSPEPAVGFVAETHRDPGQGHHDGPGMPGDIPMADLGDDRDGLMLDALHVPLGPLLPDWPAGLVLRLVLQGDVIREAEVEVLDPPADAGCFWAEPAQRAARGEPVTLGEVARRTAAGHLDGLSRFLGVAGWADPGARARLLRDALLAGHPVEGLLPELRDLAARVRRSRTLRWLVRGIPAGDDDVDGCLTTRLSALGASLDALEDTRPAGGVEPAVVRRLAVGRPVTTADELAAALVGAEFAAARLVVAALDPDPALITLAREAPQHENA